MLDTLRRALWVLVALVIGGTGLVAALYWTAGSHAPAAAIGGAFSLIDQNGQSVTEQTFKGKATAFFFGFTHCPDVCPTTLFEMSERLKSLGPDASRLNVVFVTVDPERDTPPVLKDYLSAFDPRISGLSGSPSQTEQILQAFRVYHQRVPLEGGGYNIDHTASIFLLDKNGALAGLIDYQENEETALRKLRRVLSL